MLLRGFWICLAASFLFSDALLGEVSNGRFAPRRPGEPSSRELLQQRNQAYESQFRQSRPLRSYAAPRVSQPPVSSDSSAHRPLGQVREAGAIEKQRFAPTRPGDRRAVQARKDRVSTKTVKTAYNIYKGYHSIKQATMTAQARTAEDLFVEAVEDTTSPPTVAKIMTYPVKLVANVVVEVVRTVAVDLWRF